MCGDDVTEGSPNTSIHLCVRLDLYAYQYREIALTQAFDFVHNSIKQT